MGLVREHFRLDGRPKIAYGKEKARAEALRTRMKAYKCSFCSKWHLAKR